MINHILLICSSILIYEFTNYIQFTIIIKSNLKIYKKILRLFRYKNISDFRKEKLLFNYSKTLFCLSIKIFLILFLILFLVYVLSLLSKSFFDLIISILGIIEFSLVITIYHQLRKKINAKLQ